MITTTLNRIVWADCLDKRSHARLLKGLGKKRADDEPLPFSRIVEINGLEDAILCFAAEPQYARAVTPFSVWCARRVQHLMLDPRSITALDVAERYARGEATLGRLKQAIDAAAGALASALLKPKRKTAWLAAWSAWAATAAVSEHVVSLAVAQTAWAATAAAYAAADEIAAQTAEFLRIVNETEART